MAQIEIKKWDIAELLGLEYNGESSVDRSDYSFSYRFDYLNEDYCEIPHDYYNCPDSNSAKEQAAEKLFVELKEAIKSRRT